MNKDHTEKILTPIKTWQQSNTKSHDVASQLAAVKSQIKTATDQRPEQYGVEPVTLVAVSKRQPAPGDDTDLVDAVLFERLVHRTHVQRAHRSRQTYRNERGDICQWHGVSAVRPFLKPRHQN